MKKLPLCLLLLLMLMAIASFGQSEVGDISVGVYVMPSTYLFDSDQPRVTGGINYGLVTGYQLKERITLRVGLEYHEIDRSVLFTASSFTYRHRFYEIFVEGRYRLNKISEKINFYVLGGGGMVLGSTGESSDPMLVEHRLFYHQPQLSAGVGNSFEITPKLSILGGVLIKVDPGSVIGESFSFINYSYLVGIRLGAVWTF